MAWWQIWKGKTFRATDHDSPLYGDAYGEESVSVAGAMKLSAFWACVRLISQTVATLPLGVFEKTKDGEKIARPDHPLHRLLHDAPNYDQTAVEFWEGRVLGLCTAGNGFAEKIMGDGGRLISLEPMPPDTFVDRLDSGALEYKFMQYGKQRTLSEDKVFHIRGFGDSYVGLSPVSAAARTLGIAQDTERETRNIMARGMRMKGFFTFPQKLSPEQREQIDKNLINPFSGPNAKDWGRLEAGVDAKTVTFNPRDAELILNRKFNVEDVCRWLGVMPILIGHAAEGQTMWGTGVGQIMLGWYILGLRPYLERIEQAINKRLLAPEERGRIFAEFNAEGLLRADPAARGDFYSKLFQLGAMTSNQVCDKENLPRFEGGDRHFVNSTYVPIELAGKQSASAPPPQQLLDALGAPLRRLKIMDVTQYDDDGRVMQTVTREIENGAN
jgi:HK97 family phage portal protein